MRKITVSLQIGNSDDKLTQLQWSDFVTVIGNIIQMHKGEIHFFATSEGSQPWQNAAWIFNVSENSLKILQKHVTETRKDFKQDSVAWLEGITVFI